MSSDDSLYLAVAKELKANIRDEALWTKAFALENGDETRTKACYIRLRVEKMQRPVEPDMPPTKQSESVSTPELQLGRVKSITSVPNVLVLILYVAVSYRMAEKYGFSVFSLARALGVCLIPIGVCLAWSFGKRDTAWLRVTSISVTVAFGVILVASSLQEAKEKVAKVSEPVPTATVPLQPFNPFPDWREVSRLDGVVGYYDANSIIQTNGKVLFSWLADRVSPDQYGAYSTVFEMDVDCNVPLGRFLRVTGYREHMGSGERVFENKLPSDLSKLEQGTFAQNMRQKYCLNRPGN